MMGKSWNGMRKVMTAAVLALVAFFAALFGVLTLDRSTARAADGDPVGLTVKVQAGKDIINGMSEAAVGDTLEVYYVNESGESTQIFYNADGRTGFSVSGSTQVESGSLSQSNEFTVSYNGLTWTGNLTVQVNRVKTIDSVTFNPTEEVTSTSTIDLFYGYLSAKATYYDGSTATLNNLQFVESNFAPQATTRYNGTDSTFVKQMTVRYTHTVNGREYSLDKELDVTVNAVTPSSVMISYAPAVNAKSYLEGYVGSFTFTVMYSDGLFLTTTRYDTGSVRYGDAEGNTSDSDGKPHTSFVYDNGFGTVGISYTENNTTVRSVMRRVTVNRISVSPVSFTSPVYRYDSETMQGEVQTILPVSTTFDNEYMQITGIKAVTKVENAPTVIDTKDGVYVTDAGEYEVTITLTDDAYEWQNVSGADINDRNLTVTLTVTKATMAPPKLSLTGGCLKEPDVNNGTQANPYRWNHGETPEAVVSDNISGGDESYTYYDQNGGQLEACPTATGSYSMTVTVAETSNFYSSTSNRIYFRIGRRELKLPAFTDTLVYSGNAQDISAALASGGETWETYTTYADITVTAVDSTDAGFGGISPVNAGTYTVKFTIKSDETKNAMWVSGDERIYTTTLTILRRGLAVPEMPERSYIYSLTNQNVTLTNFVSAHMTISGTISDKGLISYNKETGELVAHDAGTYQVTIGLKDSDNYCWGEDGSSDLSTHTVSWTIDPKPISVPKVDGPYEYNATEQKVTFIEDKALTNDGAYTISGVTLGIDAKTYKAIFALNKNSNGETNYVWQLDGTTYSADQTVEWTIAPYTITTKPSVNDGVYDPDGISGDILNFYATDSDIFGEEAVSGTVMTSAVSVTADGFTVNGDKVTAVNWSGEGGYKIEITLSNNYRWGDGLGADGQTLVITWLVYRLGVVAPTEVQRPTYSGSTLAYKLENVVYFVHEYRQSGQNESVSPVDAGSYDVVFMLPSENYSWGANSIAAPDDLTYTLEGGLVIGRALITRPTWEALVYTGGSNGSNIYNYGEIITALPEGYNSETSGYTITGNTGMEAGSYVLTATPDGNHMWSDGDNVEGAHTIEWTIAPLAIALPTHEEVQLTYNGTAQSVTIDNWTAGQNSINPLVWVVTGDYKYNTDNSGVFTATDAGVYTLAVKLSNTNNFKWADDSAETTRSICTVTINARVLTYEWNAPSSLVYSNSAKTFIISPTNLCEGDQVLFSYAYAQAGSSVVPSAIDAGNYTVTVSIAGGEDAHNYTLTGAADTTHSFEITKYTIVTSELLPDFFADTQQKNARYLEYNGKVRTPAVEFSSLTGLMDVDLEDVIGIGYSNESSMNYGTYYLLLTLKDTDNYTWWVSSFTLPGTQTEDELDGSNTVRMWYQITKTLLNQDLVQFAFSNGEDSWTYGDTGNTPDYNRDSYLEGMTATIYYSDAATASEAINDAMNNPSDEMKSLPTAAGKYFAVLVIETSEASNYADYNAAISFTISPKKTTITFNGEGWKDGAYAFTYDGQAISVSVTANGLAAPGGGDTTDTQDSLNISFSYSGSSNDGTFVPGSDAPTHAGSYLVTVSIDNSNYTLTGTIEAAITIGKATLTVAYAGGSITYGDDALTPALDDLTISGWFGSDADIPNLLDAGALAYAYYYGSATGTPGYTAGSPVGDYYVLPRGLEADDYTFDYNASGVLTVNQRKITLTVSGDGLENNSKTYDAQPVEINVTPNGLFWDDKLSYTYTYTYTSFNGSEDFSEEETAKNAGKWMVTVTLATGTSDQTGNYILSESGSYTFEIEQRKLTFAFTQDGAYSLTYGEEIGTESTSRYGVTVGNWAGEEVFSGRFEFAFRTYRGSGDAAYVYAPGSMYGSVGDAFTVTITSIGEDLDTFLANYDYSGYDDVTASLTVNQRKIALSVSGVGLDGNNTKTYDAQPVEIYVDPSWIFGDGTDDQDELSYVYTYTFNKGAGIPGDAKYAKNAGAWTVQVGLASGGVNANYAATAELYHFTIDKAELKASFTPESGYKEGGYFITYGDAAPVYALEYSGFVPGDNEEALKANIRATFDDADYAPGAANGSVKSYTVRATITGSGLANYCIAGNEPNDDNEYTISTTLHVAEKKITVSVGSLSSVYGSPIMKYISAASLAQGSSLVDGDVLGNLITFVTETADGSSALTLSQTTDVGVYRLTANDNSANYAIGFIYPDNADYATYSITNASMADVFYNAYAGTYDGKFHAVLQAAGSVTTVNNQEATWWFWLDGSEPDDWTQGFENLTVKDAGSYTVFFRITADNHNEKTGSFTVSIEKLALSIKADATITYGDAFAFDTSMLLYQYGGEWTKAFPNGESLTLAGISLSAQAADAEGAYAQGSNAGSYIITLKLPSGDIKNYTVALEEGTLTVIARQITVTIEDKTGMFGSTYGSDLVTPSAELTEGTIYETEGVGDIYDLVTFAILTAEGVPVTNLSDVGYYFIVGSYNADSPFGNVPVSNNYTITFVGSRDYDGQTGVAGSYQISARSIGIVLTLDKGEEEEDSAYLTYDGSGKGYVASYNSEDTAGLPAGADQIVFVYSYTGTTFASVSYSSSDKPTQAGEYSVTVTAQGGNYVFSYAETAFTIARANYEMPLLTDLLGETDLSGMHGGTPYSAYVYAFDGEAHLPSLMEGKLPEGADNSVPGYLFDSEGKTNVCDEGDSWTSIGGVWRYYRFVTITFTAGSANYNAPAAMSFLLVVTPKEVEVEWGDEREYTYNGTNQIENIKPYFVDVRGEQVWLELVGRDSLMFRDYREQGYTFMAEFTGNDNVKQNYVLEEASATAAFMIRKRQVTISIEDDEMEYGDATPTQQADWWSYADGSLQLIEGDGVSIVITARISAGMDGAAVTYQTGAGDYFLVGQASAAGSVLNNYAITFTGSNGESGTFTVKRRAITVTIGDVSSTYGEEQADLTANITSGRLSAADAAVGPNGETLLGDNAVISLAVSVAISEKTSAGSYTIAGLPINTNYDITFVGSGSDGTGVYTVEKARFADDDFTLAGYEGVYDGLAHQALDWIDLTGSAAAALVATNDLTLTYYVVRENVTTGGDAYAAFTLTHVAESDTYYVYVVATDASGVECYERRTYSFKVQITTAENETSVAYAWNDLMYHVSPTSDPTAFDPKFGSGTQTLLGFYTLESGGTQVAADENVFRAGIADGTIGAGTYYARFSVPGGQHEGEYDWGDADGDTFAFAVTVAKYTVVLNWSVGDSLTFRPDDSRPGYGLDQTNTLKPAATWMEGAFGDYFTFVSTAGGGSLSYSDSYPQITASVAGIYSITLRLIDTDNYCWQQGSGAAEYTFTFSISAESNTVTITIHRQDWTYGDTQNLSQEEIIGYAPDGETGDLFISFTVTAPGTYTYLFESLTGKGGEADGKYRSSVVPTNAGWYRVTVTVLGTEAYGSASDTEEFEIARRAIAVPEFAQETTSYNGALQQNALEGYVSGIMWITGLSIGTDAGGIFATATDVGVYTGTIALTDKSNYIWALDAGNSDADQTLIWTMEKGTPVLTGPIVIAGWTYGDEANAPSGVTAGFEGGTLSLPVIYRYYTQNSAGGYVPTASPSDAGTYYVAAMVEGNDNYNAAWLMAGDVILYQPFIIAQADGSKLTGSVSMDVSDNVYLQTPVFAVGGLAQEEYTLFYYGASNDGTWNVEEGAASEEAPTLAGQYFVIVRFTGNTNYTAEDFIFGFEIERARYTSSVQIENWMFGTQASAPEVTNNPENAVPVWYYGGTSNDGTWDAVSGSTAAPTQAGYYTVYAYFPETANYASCTTAAVSFSISRARVALSVSIEDWTYGSDASVYEVSGYGEGEQSVSVRYDSITVYDGTTYIGQEQAPEKAGYYRLTASVAETANYLAATATDMFYILRATLTLSVTMDSWTYGETAGTPGWTIEGMDTLPEGAQLTWHYDGAAYDGSWSAGPVRPTAAGTYTVSATLSQSANYQAAVSEGASFEIRRASYTLDGITFEDLTQTYSGSAYAIAITGELPVGLDGIPVTVTYAYNGGTSSAPYRMTDAGVYAITATLSSESENYEAIEWSREATLTIEARAVAVRWDRTEYTYNGSEQEVTAYYLDVNGERQELFVAIEGEDAFRDAGPYNATASFLAEDTNYRLTDTAVQLTMNRLAVTVTIRNQSATYGDADVASPELTAQASEELPDGDAAVYRLFVEGIAADGKVHAGTYVITGEVLEEAERNYAIHFVDGSYTVERRLITVNITAGGGTYGETITPAQISSVHTLVEGDTQEEALAPFLVWNYSGTANDGTTWSAATAPTLAGSYSVTLTLAGTAGEVSCDYMMMPVSAGFTVARQTIAPPVLAGLPYSGEEQSIMPQATEALSAINDGNIIAVLGTGEFTGTQAGQYIISFLLNDPANYRWNGIAVGTAEVSVVWQIHAIGSDGMFVSAPTLMSWTYDNTAHLPTGSVLSIGELQFPDAQIVYVYAATDSDNPADYRYDPYTDAGTYYVRAYVAATNDHADVYSSATEYTIEKATYELDGISFTGDRVTYNGAPHSISIEGTLPTGLDGIGVVPTYTLGGQESVTPLRLTDTGVYTITVTLSSASRNYEAIEWSREATLTIEARAVTVRWDRTEYIYNGSEQEITAYYLDVNDERRELSVAIEGEDAFRDAGLYNATASFLTEDTNYRLTDAAVQITMKKFEAIIAIDSKNVTYGDDAAKLTAKSNVTLPDKEGDVYELVVIGLGERAAAGTYVITGSLLEPLADNYSLRFVDGSYTVERRLITVNITAGGGTYGETISPAQISSVHTLVEGDTQEEALAPFLVWNYSGTANDGTAWNAATAPTLAGSYTVTLTLAGMAEETVCNYTMQTVSAVFTVARQALTAPELAGFAYNGAQQSVLEQAQEALALLNDGEEIVSLAASNSYSATDVGRYPIGYVLADTDNYRWNGIVEGEPSLTVYWQITQAQPQSLLLSVPTLAGWTYDNTAHTPSGSMLSIGENVISDAAIVYVYSTADGELSAYRPEPYTDAGTYYVRAYVAETANYAQIYSDAVEYTIGKASYTLDGITFEDLTQTYSGSAYAIAITGELPVGLDGIPVTVTYAYNGGTSSAPYRMTDAGVYAITATLSSESENYEAIEWSREATLTIEARAVAVRWDRTEYTYNGSEQEVTAYYLDVNGERQELFVAIEGEDAFRDAGPYNATASFLAEDTNYRLTDTAVQLTMNRLAVTVTIRNQSATYGDASVASPALGAVESVPLPDSASSVYRLYVVGLGSRVNAGTYVIRGIASGTRSGNYDLTFVNGTYTVNRRAINVSIIAGGGTYGGTITPADVMVPASALVNGDTQASALDPYFVWTYSGTSNSGRRYNGSTVPTEAGSYSVTLSLRESIGSVLCNYSLNPVSAGFNVARRTVTVPVLAGFTYSGAPQSVEEQAVAAVQQLNSVFSGVVSLFEGNNYTATDAGEYTVIFLLSNADNYRWEGINEGVSAISVVWQIRPAQEGDGLLLSAPTLADWIYDNTAHLPTGSVLTIGGLQIPDAQILYVYATTDSDNPADYRYDPYTDAGTYYVRAYVAATADHAGVYSDAVEYTIDRAQYDFTGLAFSDLTVVYSGTDHSLSLTGELPVGLDGIAVTAVYTLGDQTQTSPIRLRDAGEYTVTVSLRSVSTNYLAPEWTQNAVLIINPRTVEVRWDRTEYTYNGSEQAVTAYYLDILDTRVDLAVSIDGIFRDAGTYTATASFAAQDPNYVLSGTQARLTMRAAEVSVTLKDQSAVYSGRAPVIDQVAYTVEGADAAEELDITLSVSDPASEWNAGTYQITGTWNNANYHVTFRSGTLTITPASVSVLITLNDNLVYDGNAKTATAEIVSGLVDGDTLNVMLVYSGTANDKTTWNSSQAPVKAGTYLVRALIDSANYRLAEEGAEEEFVISRALVQIPVIDTDDTPFTIDTEKTGDAQSIRIPIELDRIGVRGAGVGTGLIPNADGSISLQATEEGRYSVTLFLRDADNYAWSDGTTDDVTLEWNIVQNGLDPMIWAIIILAILLLIALIVLLIYFLTNRKEDKEEPGDGGSDASSPDAPEGGAPQDGTDLSDGEAVSGSPEDGVQTQTGEEEPEEPEVAQAAPEETSAEAPSGSDNGEEGGETPSASGKTVLNSFAAPVLFGLLAITGWQIAGVALLSAAFAAIVVAESMLYTRRAKRRRARREAQERQAAAAAAAAEAAVAAAVPAGQDLNVQEEEEEIPTISALIADAEPQEEQEGMTAEEENEQDDGMEFGVTIVDGRQILVRYNYSFRAKLIQAPADVQGRFGQLMDEFESYPQVRTKESWRQIRVYTGRTTLASVFFKGRKLSVAFALDPKEYEETKYHGQDVSSIRRYAKTPLLLKVFSDRKLGYAKYLFSQVAAKFGLEQGEVVAHTFSLPYQTTEELLEEKLVRLFANQEDGGTREGPEADISPLIREKISMREAQLALTDEMAEKYLEEAPQETVQAKPAENADSAAEEPASSIPRKERGKKGIVNLDVLSQTFAANETVTLARIREAGLVPANVEYLKVLARGYIDKPLIVEAQDFSIDAVKMLLLTGGRAIRRK